MNVCRHTRVVAFSGENYGLAIGEMGWMCSDCREPFYPPERRERVDPDLRAAAWSFLNHITVQDYAGGKVAIDLDALNAFRAILAATEAPREPRYAPVGDPARRGEETQTDRDPADDGVPYGITPEMKERAHARAHRP